MTIKTVINFIISASFFLSMLQPAYAGIYKWVDENGQVHYGEEPGSRDAEKLQIRQNETTTPRTINKAEEETLEQAAEKPAEPAKTEEPKISKKEKQRLCQEGENDYAAISSRGRMREINKKGEYIYLTEEQRQQRLAAAKQKQRKYCH